MNIYDWINDVTLFTSGILILLFGATLVRILRGSKLTNVAIITGLLFVANIFNAASTVPYFIIIKASLAGDFTRASIAAVWNNALSAVYWVGFFESHWLIAIHYWKTATNTPKVLRKEKTESTTRSQKFVTWIGITVCAVLPIAASYYNAKDTWQDLHGKLTKSTEIMAAVAYGVEMITLIVIGVISIASVLLIRRFMQAQPRSQGMSIKALLIHAGAFGLFLVSVMIFTIAWIFENFYPDSQTVIMYTNVAQLVLFVFGFISQCCICYVFWQLGEKIE
jgi:hypothetical protein